MPTRSAKGQVLTAIYILGPCAFGRGVVEGPSPWGRFESIASSDRFPVKRIFVMPGALLSLQSHNHCVSHWIVVAGTAHMTIGDEVRMVTENQSVYVSVGERHRLKNRLKLPVTLIEARTGPYLAEDDIIRYDDAYARA